MKEKMKTLALTLLVICSLVLSLGIWGITPQYEAIDTPQYANVNITDPSNQRNVASVVMPRSVTLHFGGQKHTAVFPGQSGYQDALALLRQATFSNLTITNDFGEPEWRKLVNDTQSLQYNFDVDLSGTLFDQADLTNIHSRVEPSMVIHSLYLFKAPDETDLKAWFYGGPDNRMYVARVILPKDVYGKLFEELKNEPEYTMYGQTLARNFYLPTAVLKLQNYSLEVAASPHTQSVIDSLFVDSTLTRRVLERDGSQIITDGTRLVRVVAKDKSIEYRNLSLDRNYGQQVEADFAIQKALGFLNDHGGMAGQWQVLMHEVRTNAENQGSRRSYAFRLYLNGFPVIGNLSTVYADVVDTDVATMKRSQMTIGPRKNKDKLLPIQPGAQLLKNVESDSWLDRNKVTDVYLAYLIAPPHDQTADLRPVWVVEEAGDARSAVFDAVTGELLQSVEGI